MTTISGKFLRDASVKKEKLSLVNPTAKQDAVTVDYSLKNNPLYITLTDFRLKNKTDLSDKVIVGDHWYKFDVADTTSVDNGDTVIRTLDNKIYKKIIFSTDPTVLQAISDRLSYGTSSDFQTWFNDAFPSFYLTDAGKEGLFRYDSTDTTTPASARTLVKGAKRFKKEYTNYVSVTEFGAKGDYNPTTQTGTDDTVAFQAALDYASNKGLALLIDEGSYLISDTLRPKKVNNKKDFRLTLVGKGKGVSNIHGKRTDNSLVGKNLLDFDFQVGDDPAWTNSEIKISDITFWAGKADRCLYADRVIDIELDTCALNRGEIECLRIGSGNGDGNTFAAYVHNCYFGGSTDNGSINSACMVMHSSYAEVYNNVSDGGKYALLTSGGQMYIAGNTFEGSKTAGIYMTSSGGGGCKIIGNTIRPYGGYDPSGKYTGEQYGIHIESVSGGVPSNTIIGNQIFIPDPIGVDIVGNLTSVTGTIVPSPHAIYKIIGQTSGTEGLLIGYNVPNNTVNLLKTSGSGFITGETILQPSPSGGSFVISSFVTNIGSSLLLRGSAGYNVVTGNRFAGGTYVIRLESPGNTISNNSITGVRDGIYVSTSAQILGNYISLFAGSGSYTAIKRVGTPNVVFDNNVYNGTLDNIAPQQLSNITTTNRNALTSGQKYSGLLLNDTTLNKLTHWDGTNWNIIPIERFISGTAGVTDLDTTGVSGSFTWGADTLNKPEGYGTLLNIVGATSNGDATTTAGSWLNQLLFGTQGEIYWRQRLYSYGTFTPSGGAAWKLWTSKHFSPIAAQTNSAATTSTVAAGATPTKAEFDALRADYLAVKSTLDSLLTKMRTSKILLT